MRRSRKLKFLAFIFFGITTILFVWDTFLAEDDIKDFRRSKKDEPFLAAPDDIKSNGHQQLEEVLMEKCGLELPKSPDIFFPKHIVHIDLKGAPPKIDILIKWISMIKNYGAFGVLLEYEDMFPWNGVLSSVKSNYAYTENETRKILKHAENIGLHIIPLIQSFGHLEFILKHRQFRKLRRNNHEDWRSLNPLSKISSELVMYMIDQIFYMHRNLKWIHLGGDEVFDLGTCESCNERYFTKENLYLEHMLPILEYVKNKGSNQNVRPIIWDDMLRSFSLQSITKLAVLTDFMVWDYSTELSVVSEKQIWDKYFNANSRIWLAGAFKGADGEKNNFPKPLNRVCNYIAWMIKASELYAIDFHVNGYVLTGWSRYSHDKELCELFPAAIPLLALFLTVGKSKNFDILSLNEKVSKVLGFKETFDIFQVNAKHMIIEYGKFDQTEIYYAMALLEKTIQRCSLSNQPNSLALSQQLSKGLLFLKHCNDSLIEIRKKYLESELHKVYFKDTVDEIIKSKIEKSMHLIEETVRSIKYYHEIGLVMPRVKNEVTLSKK